MKIFDSALDFHYRQSVYGDSPYELNNMESFAQGDEVLFARRHDILLCCKVMREDPNLGVKHFSVPVATVSGVAINTEICPVREFTDLNEYFKTSSDFILNTVKQSLLDRPESLVTQEIGPLFENMKGLPFEVDDSDSLKLCHFNLSPLDHEVRINQACKRILHVSKVTSINFKEISRKATREMDGLRSIVSVSAAHKVGQAGFKF